MPEFCYEVNFLQFDFTGKRCAVLGLGISNLPLIDFLLDRGALVSARDQKSVDGTDPRIAAWRARGVEFVTGDGYLDDIRADYVFRSPGIRPDLDGIAAAVQNGAVLTSEMELFFALCPAKKNQCLFFCGRGKQGDIVFRHNDGITTAKIHMFGST